MADNAESTDVATLEAEVAAARERLARTLDKLTDPATHEAMKHEVMERVQGYKDGLLSGVERSARETGQGIIDDLKTRAMNNPAGAALIGAGIAYRLYRHPPITTLLVGAGTALLMRARGKRASNRDAYRAPYDRKQPRGYVPGGVAGYGYPVEEDAPGSTTTDRLMARAEEARERASEIGGRARDAAYEARSRIADTAERAREAASDTVERTRAAAHEVRSRVAETAERARETAYDTVDHTRAAAHEVADRARSTAHDAYARTANAAEMAYARTGEAYERVRTDPWLLGALGVAAGAALAVAMRQTERGDRFVRATGGLGEGGVRGVGSAARAAASRAADVASTVASTAGSAASGVADSVERAASAVTSAASGLGESVAERWGGEDSEPAPRTRRGRQSGATRGRRAGEDDEDESDFMGSAAEAASSAYRTAAEQADYARRRAAGFAGWARDEVTDLAENYPLLLGAIGLAAGAAAGLAMRPSASEDDLMGSFSDEVKSRARAFATEQYHEVVGAAEDLANAFSEPRKEPGPGADTAADWETVIGGGAPRADRAGASRSKA